MIVAMGAKVGLRRVSGMVVPLGLAMFAAGAHADVRAGADAWSRGDYPAAVAEWQGPAAKGDADAMFNMGQAYKLGRGVPKDMAKAEDFYRRAAQKGHLRAADNYGVLLFQNGRQADAIPWLTASADRGEPRAMYILGIAAYNGDYATKDWVRAYALMSRAAAGGLAQAVTSLAAMNDAIPLDQRQKGVALAQELDRKAADARQREMAAADLGSAAQPVAPAKPVPLATTPLPPSAAYVAAAPAGNPTTAGADYAAPVVLPRHAAAAAARPAPQPAAKPATPPPAAPAGPTHAATGDWRVQLGAFGQKANADALWGKMRTRPEIAGHARIDSPGAVSRLMAGGYSEAAAKAACAALKSAGQTCIVVNR